MEKIVIIGAGPAGVSAALYAVRGNADPLVIDNGIGALQKAEKIENYYGLERPLSGAELYERGIRQAKALGVRFLEAQMLSVRGYDPYEVVTTAGNIETQSIIFATGGKRTAPPIEGLSALEGHGVSYCAVCDAFFYRGKDVAVLGSGDFALHEAEELAAVANSVTLLTDGKETSFSKEHGFPVRTEKVAAIEGTDGAVSGVSFESGDVLAVSGVFVALGTAGSADMARQMGAALTDKGNIRINAEMATNVPGVFAAGDCTGGLLQVVKAVYEGAQAGLSAVQYVRKKN